MNSKKKSSLENNIVNKHASSECKECKEKLPSHMKLLKHVAENQKNKVFDEFFKEVFQILRQNREVRGSYLYPGNGYSYSQPNQALKIKVNF